MGELVRETWTSLLRNETGPSDVGDRNAKQTEPMDAQKQSLITEKRIWIAGHQSPAGLAIIRRLWFERCDIVLWPSFAFDANDRSALFGWMEEQQPDIIILADPSFGDGNSDRESAWDVHRLVDDLLASAHGRKVERLVVVAPSPLRRLRDEPGRDIPAFAEALSGRTSWHAASLGSGLVRGQVERYGCRLLALTAPTVYAPKWPAEWGPPHFLSELVSCVGHALLGGTRRIAISADFELMPPAIHADDLADAVAYALAHCHDQAVLRCGSSLEVRTDQLVQLVADVIGFHDHIQIRYRRRPNPMRTGRTGYPIESFGWKGRNSLQDGILEIYHAWLDQQISASSGIIPKQ